MSDFGNFSDKPPNLSSTDIKEIEQHYYRIITHHIERARIPTTYGWTSKVVACLQTRIDALSANTPPLGQQALEVADIAKELDVPLRTLQNHLSQEGTNFSNLRDIVRQHYAIAYLVQGKRVEEIFPILDFKDRTGLVNAFKRWTGLPPSHFRKFYNIYVKNKV